MPSFFLRENRLEQDKKKTKYAFDLFIPYNAGRQVVRRDEKFPGGYNAERPSNAINLREWISSQLESAYIRGGTFRYQTEESTQIVASALGVTTSNNAGTISVLVPKNVDLYKFQCIGTLNNLGGVNADELVIDIVYDPLIYDFNQDLSTLTIPNISILDLTLTTYNNDEINASYPALDISTYDPPTKQITLVGSNRLTIKIQGLQNYGK